MQYLREKKKDEVDFLASDKRQRFLQIDTIILGVCVCVCVCVSRNAEITQISKFGICLQYLKKKVCDEIDFSHTDKQKSFLQFDTLIFDRDGQALPEFQK